MTTDNNVNLPIHDGAHCPVLWQELAGGEHVRWSARCGHFIYNPGQLTDEALAAIVLFREMEPPDSLYRRKDGLLIAARCRAGQHKSIQPVAMAVAAVAALSVALFSQLSARPHVPVAAAGPIATGTVTASAQPEDRPAVAAGVKPGSTEAACLQDLSFAPEALLDKPSVNLPRVVFQHDE